MPASQTQARLRQLFARYGQPRRMRVDNGTPWASRGDLPTELTLWLAGLDITVITNRPRCPQENGVVERSQGTTKRWCEPRTAHSADELQQRVERFDELQRSQYPYRAGQSRAEVFPQLVHSGRAYEESSEPAQWSFERAQDRLAGSVAVRRVDAAGRISIYNRSLYAGKSLAGQTVYVRYEPQQQRWQIHDQHHHLLNHHPAPEISPENICALTVSNRRDHLPPTQRQQSPPPT